MNLPLASLQGAASAGVAIRPRAAVAARKLRLQEARGTPKNGVVALPARDYGAGAILCVRHGDEDHARVVFRRGDAKKCCWSGRRPIFPGNHDGIGAHAERRCGYCRSFVLRQSGARTERRGRTAMRGDEDIELHVLPLYSGRVLRIRQGPCKRDLDAACDANGGQGWIRTNVPLREQIYSLPPLTTRPPVHVTPKPSSVRSERASMAKRALPVNRVRA